MVTSDNWGGGEEREGGGRVCKAPREALRCSLKLSHANDSISDDREMDTVCPESCEQSLKEGATRIQSVCVPFRASDTLMDSQMTSHSRRGEGEGREGGGVRGYH